MKIFEGKEYIFFSSKCFKKMLRYSAGLSIEQLEVTHHSKLKCFRI